MENSIECKHGAQKRKCEICELEARVAELERMAAEMLEKFHNYQDGEGLSFATVCASTVEGWQKIAGVKPVAEKDWK